MAAVPPTATSPLATIAWLQDDSTLHAQLPAAGGASHNLTFGVVDSPPRLKVGLSTGVRARPLDISRQPGVVERLVDEATACATAPGATHQQVIGHLARHLSGHGAWTPDPSEHRPDGLLALVGGAAFPLLAAAYDRRVPARREIPAWAAPVLALPDARTAAVRALGSPAASRPVIAALAGSLAPRTGPVDLTPLALARMSARTLDPDRLARLLTTPRPPGGDGAQPSPEPAEEDIRRGVRACRSWGPEVTAGVLTDALEHPEGIPTLLDLLAHWSMTSDQLRVRLPRRLDALRSLVHDHLPGDPDPAWRARRLLAEVFDDPQASEAVTPAGPARRPDPVLADPALPEPVAQPRSTRLAATRPLAPPTAQGPLARSGFTHPPHLRALDGATTGSLRLVLPRTPDELTAWGQQLGNCLADFGVAVSTGRSHLIGVEVDDRLRYCLEITPRGRVRQFLGTGNRPPAPEHHRATLELLRARGVARNGHR